MDNDSGHVPSRAQRLHEVLAAYREAVETGQKPDQHQWIQQHPDLAVELADLFAGQPIVTSMPGPVPELPSQSPANALIGSRLTTIQAITPPLEESAAEANVRFVGDYELLEEIARGGMGVVYKARQISLNRVVALKMILAGQLASEIAILRFRTEAEAAASLDHPNIVPIYEIGEHEGQQYFCMKYMEGGTLVQQLPRLAKDPHASAKVVATIARAVNHAHQRGTLHRDLKPANILLDAAGQPQIADFGLAKRIEGDNSLTHTGAIMGTPSYMAPEQACGKKGAVTTLTDVYSLGAILYELLTGRAPFRGETPLETIKQVEEQDPVPPSKINRQIDRNLEAICLKCLQKDPQHRYQTAAAFAEDLEHWQRGEPIQARPPTLAFLVWQWLRQNFGAAIWTMIIGSFCGALISLPLIYPDLLRLSQVTSDAYAKFPSLPMPWIGRLWPFLDSLSDPFVYVMPILIAAPVLAVGLFTALLLRPKDLFADIIAGLSTGIVAGLAAFSMGIGWLWVSHFTLTRSYDDTKLLAHSHDVNQRRLGAARASLDEEILNRYPDLSVYPQPERVNYLFTKLQADLYMSSLFGIWWGMLVSLSLAAMTVVSQTIAAGFLLRSRERVSLMFLPYLELSLPVVGVLIIIVNMIRFALSYSGDRREYLYNAYGALWDVCVDDCVLIIVMIVLFVMAAASVRLAWHWLSRWTLYAIWILLCISLTSVFAGQYTEGAFSFCMLFLLGYCHCVWRRKHSN